MPESKYVCPFRQCCRQGLLASYQHTCQINSIPYQIRSHQLHDPPPGIATPYLRRRCQSRPGKIPQKHEERQRRRQWRIIPWAHQRNMLDNHKQHRRNARRIHPFQAFSPYVVHAGQRTTPIPDLPSSSLIHPRKETAQMRQAMPL